jgi:hypothetical protein
MKPADISRVLGPLAAVAILVSACGSSNGAPSDLSPTAKARLADYCAKRQTCQTELAMSPTPCPTSTCLASTTVEGPLLEYFDCQNAKQCSAFFNDDDCAASAGTSDPERDAFRTRCTARMTACNGDADFAAFCAIGSMPLLRSEWMHAIDACLGEACDDIYTCVNAVPIPDCW